MADPAVSVVIPTHNRPGRLAAQLASLRAQTLRDFEVIVIDDGSAAATGEVLEAEQARGELDLRTIRRHVRQGPAKARNVGWRAARAPLIAFTDDDCVSRPGWLAAGLEAWGGDEDVFVQGRTSPIPEELPQLGPFDYSLEIDSLTPETETCNMFYPRSALERLGGFDETFAGPQAEDTDLGWRARAAGLRPVFAADAHMEHAVMSLGPLGALRRAWRWTPTVRPFSRHPELRRQRLFLGYFWNWSHYLLLRGILALPFVCRRWGWPLAWWLAHRLLDFELSKARRQGGSIGLASYWVLHDVVETAAIVRGAVRYRTPVV